MPAPSEDALKPKPQRDRSVFINCPFDSEYQPLLRAGCFTILACGFAPRCALDLGDSGKVRFDEIVKMISDCDYSIHDISRVELDKASQLPRFNMPLELGADLGLRFRGPRIQRRRKTLVLDTEKHRYDVMLSDISGMDIESHENNARNVVLRIRDWLNLHQRTGGARILPGANAIWSDYEVFESLVPDILSSLRLDDLGKLHHVDFLRVVELALPLLERRIPT